MSRFLLAIAIALMLNALVCLYRVVRGPTAQDRLIGVNIINTSVLVVLLLSFFVADRPTMYLDIALVYALLNFIVTVALSRFLETGRKPLG